MNFRVNSDAEILLPNAGHQNFVKSEKTIPAGTILEGKKINIKGKRRGQDFTYRLFQTKEGLLIFESKISPMNTEVNLGADGKPSTQSTQIKLPNKAVQNAHLIGAVLGTIGGFLIAKKMKKPVKHQVIFGVLGAASGYAIGRLIAGKPVISIKTPAVIETR